MDKNLAIVGVTYKHGSKLDVFVSSILAQTSSEWLLTVIHDGPDQETEERMSKYLTHPRISYLASPERQNIWGHNLRADGLKLAQSEYIHITNCDNYYCPVFVDRMLTKARVDNLDLVICDLLHSYAGVNGDSQPEYNVLKTHPSINRSDWANFVIKTDVMREIGLNHLKESAADGLFLTELMNWRPGTRWGKIESVLAVHN